MSIKHSFKVGDKIVPNVNAIFFYGGKTNLGEYLKSKYGVDINGEFEVYKESFNRFWIKQGAIDCLSWSRSNLWSLGMPIVDLDEDDEGCI